MPQPEVDGAGPAHTAPDAVTHEVSGGPKLVSCASGNAAAACDLNVFVAD